MDARAVRTILSRNPYPHRYTLGMFYREKMRAIASILPAGDFRNVLDVGGGRSSLSAILFPSARIVNVDTDPEIARAWPWMKTSVRLVPGSATGLPIRTGAFDCVTAFDVLEHVPNDALAVGEIGRVLKPGGVTLVTVPTLSFRHPYYSFPFRRFCYPEDEITAVWGHVRRGYQLDQLCRLFSGFALAGTASYLNPLTVIAHDVSFSKLSESWKRALILLQYPITLIGYALGSPGPRLGLAAAFRKVR